MPSTSEYGSDSTENIFREMEHDIHDQLDGDSVPLTSPTLTHTISGHVLDVDIPSIPPNCVKCYKLTMTHTRRPVSNEGRWAIVVAPDGYWCTLFGNEATITKHDPNSCGKCGNIVNEFEGGSYRSGTPTTICSADDFREGRWNRRMSHNPTPRSDGRAYTLPSQVTRVDRRSNNSLGWRSRFTDDSNVDTEHDPLLCWDCIMTVTRQNDNVARMRRDYSGHEDGDMDLETGGFWINGQFVRAEQHGLPPDTEIRLNSVTNRFEMVNPNGEIFRTADATVAHSTTDDIKDELQNIFQKIDDNDDLLQKFKQHLTWFNEYGVK